MKETRATIEPISFTDPSIQVGSGRGRVIGFGFEKESENPIKEETEVKRLCQSLIPLPVEAVSETLPPPEDWPLGFIPPVSMLPQEQIRQGAGMSWSAEYEFDHAVGRAYGKQLEQLLMEKSREATQVSHELTQCNYMRGKKFADGSVLSTPLANCGVVSGKKWMINGEIWFQLKLWNPNKNAHFLTSAEPLNLLDDDKWLEKFFSKYFHPVDSRAYQKTALKTFRSRLYEIVEGLEQIKLYDTLGWQKEGKCYYADGKDYLLEKGVLATTIAPSRDTSIDINKVLAEICTGISLENTDNRKRISFLICFGLTAWLGSLLGLRCENLPGLLLTGSESESRKIAAGLLKTYQSKKGADILDIRSLDLETATEYAVVLRDDVLVVDCYGRAKHKSLLQSLVTNRSVYSAELKVPLVVLQKFPNEEQEYERYFVEDLSSVIGYEALLSAMKVLKGFLLASIEKNLEPRVSTESFETVFVELQFFVGNLLLEAGAESSYVETFKEVLLLGINGFKRQLKFERPVEVEVFCQRFRNLIAENHVQMLPYPQLPAELDSSRVIWRHEDRIRIPADFMQKDICFLLNITAADFKRIRDWLLARGFLHANKGEEYTRRIQLLDGSRMRVYELEAKLFEEDKGNVFNS